MFSAKKVSYLEKHPQKIEKALEEHIKNNAYIPRDIEKRVEKAIVLSGIEELSTAKKKWLKNDILFWYLAYGFSFNEYFSYDFINKSFEERMSYYSDRESIAFGYDMNDIDDMMLFGDKMNTYIRFQKYFGREAMEIKSDEDYDSFIAFTDKYRRFVKKNVYEACGNSVELIDLDLEDRTREDVFQYIRLEKKVILEEVVIQNKKISVFNKSSVNTLRCITLRTKQGIIIPYCFMKIGREGAFIDNGAAGGILVGVVPQTGIFGTDGVDENGRRYVEHPDSKIKFKNYQLPEWSEVIRICKEMSAMIPTVQWIGWDMAYTDNGWIVIEGNALTEVIGPQSTWQRGIRDDISAFSKNV